MSHSDKHKPAHARYGKASMIRDGFMEFCLTIRNRYDAWDIATHRAEPRLDYGRMFSIYFERHPKLAERHFAELAELIDQRIGIEGTVYPFTEEGRKTLYAKTDPQGKLLFMQPFLGDLLFPTEARERDGFRAAQILSHPKFYALCQQYLGTERTDKLYHAVMESLQKLPDSDLSPFYAQRVGQWQENVGPSLLAGDFRSRLEDKPGPQNTR